MLTHGKAYEDLRYLCKNIGSRVSGSPQAAAAVAWGQQLMESYDFDTVFFAGSDGAFTGYAEQKSRHTS